MIRRSSAVLALILATSAYGQSPAPAPEPTFLAADVHPTPRSTNAFFYAVLLPSDRFIMSNASMLDIIATAWDLDRDSIQGGPPWLDYDHFDIIAKVPPGTGKDALKLMLRTLLTGRFHVTLENGMKPMPAYTLTVAKAASKMKPADESAPASCEYKEQPSVPNTVPSIAFSCRNTTMESFAKQMRQWAGGYLKNPVIDSTGLKGGYDFDLKWTDAGQLSKAGADGVSIFDAVEKQLGLKLALETAPRPVLLVKTASQPSPNAPDVAKMLPPLPLPEFEVATIKPSKPGQHGNGQIRADRVDFQGVPLRELIDLAWDLSENDPQNIVNAPKWLDDDKFDILAKINPEAAGIPIVGDFPVDIYEVELMLRALLTERFHIKAHMEERPIDSYTLSAANPRLIPAADPGARTSCHQGPGPDGKDPRIKNPILNRLLTCQNITIPELCDQLQQQVSGYIKNPILDSTGIKGSFDLTLSFTGVGHLQLPADPASGSSPSDPNGAISLFDALKSQLGLKLEKQKRALPVLVIEHIEEKPTVN